MNISEFLNNNGPCLSSKIKEKLLEEGLSNVAARKVISRVGKNIYRADKINFPKREKFFFLKSQYKTPIFYYSMLNAFRTTSSVHFSLINSLHCFGGTVNENKIKVISACPTTRKKKKSLETILSEICSVGFIIQDGYTWKLTEDVTLSPLVIDDPKIIEYLSDLLVETFKIWIKKNSLVSYDSIKVSSEFAGFFWDLTAPSYLLPLIDKSGETIKPGFIVSDIIPQYDINADQIEYFIKKVESCSYNKKNRPFIPIIIGNSFSRDAFIRVKEKNIWITTPANLFGDEIELLLKNIIRVLKESSTINETNAIEKLAVIMKAVAKIEGESNNLRGHFFELLVGNIISTISPNTIRIGKKIETIDGRKAEIDVLTSTSNKVLIFECKGYAKSRKIKLDDINLWKGKIKIIYDWIKENEENVNKAIEFAYWTTSDFEEDAQDEFEVFKNKIRKYSIEKKNYNEIILYVRELNMPNMMQLLKEHFD